MKLHGYACGCAGCSHPDAHPAILQSNTWPSGKQTIQYSFSTSDWTGDAVRNEAITHSLTAWFQERVRDAMEAWEEVCSVRFVEVADGPDVDIRDRSGSPDMDSPDRNLFHRLLPDHEFDAFGNTQEGMVVFQVTSDWGTDPDTRFYDLALHEVGHALGLAHSELEGKVMSGPPYSSYGDVDAGRDRLTADDIAGARGVVPRYDDGSDFPETIPWPVRTGTTSSVAWAGMTSSAAGAGTTRCTEGAGTTRCTAGAATIGCRAARASTRLLRAGTRRGHHRRLPCAWRQDRPLGFRPLGAYLGAVAGLGRGRRQWGSARPRRPRGRNDLPRVHHPAGTGRLRTSSA